MLDVKDLVEGVTKVKVLSLPSFVRQKVGDEGTFVKTHKRDILYIGVTFGDIQIGEGSEGLYWFSSEHLEIVDNNDNKIPDVSSQSEDLIIYKSRWDEIIDNLEGGYGMSDEEVEVVKSVLKNNVPFNVVDLSVEVKVLK